MIKELDVNSWFTEIENGLEYRRRYGREKDWAELERIFYHVSDDMLASSPNLIAATGDALLSSLTVPNPRIIIKPKRSDSIYSATVLESVDNTLKRELLVHQEIERASLVAYLWGTGILKLGYDSEFGWTDKLDVGGSNYPVGVSMTQLDQRGNRIEFHNVKPGNPWLQVVLPQDFVVPWGTLRCRTARWCAHRVTRHIEEVKSDPKYSGTRDLAPTMSMSDIVKSYQQVMQVWRLTEPALLPSTITSEPQFVELWEIHDRITGKIYVIATGHDRFLRNEDDALQVRGLPFVDFSFVPRVRSFWTTSDAKYLLGSQKELSDITLQATKHRRLANLKALMRKGAMTEDNISKLTSSAVGAIAEVEDQGSPLSEVVQFIQPPPNMMIYQEAEVVRRNARETVGFSRNQFGEYEATGRRTAYEAAQVAQGSNLRMSRRQVVIRDTYIEIFEKINAMIMEFWQSPRIIEVLDTDGQQRFLTFKGSQLTGEYAYDVEFTTDTVLTPQMRRQQALQLFQMFIQDPAVDPAGLRRFVADAFADVEFSRIFQPGVLSGDQNANLSVPMSAMQGGGGGSQALPPGGPAGAMPQM